MDEEALERALGDETQLAVCTVPASADPADFRRWVLEDLDRMVTDRISRELDVSGGSDSMEDLMRDLRLPEFCRSAGVRFTWLCMIGPDQEDFRHVVKGVEAGYLDPADMLVVLNEGTMRSRQNPTGLFSPITGSQVFKDLVKRGRASVIYLMPLPCMDPLRDRRLDFYDVADGKPGVDGVRPRPTMTHMTWRWLTEWERECAEAGATERLP